MIKPLPGYILVSPIKEETQSGGIYLPEDINDKPCKGKVVAVGDKLSTFSSASEIRYVESPVKKGEIVVYRKWTNQEVKFEGKDYLLVKFDELLATL